MRSCIVGIQTTSVCNFKCDHCMYSCTRRGKQMSYETMQYVQAFIRDTDVYEVNIYGGEPLLDLKQFDIARRLFYNDDYRFFMSSNGTFLLSREKRRYVFDFLRQCGQTNKGDENPVSIRISASNFHKQFWSDRLKKLITEVDNLTKYGSESYEWYHSFFHNDEWEDNGVWYRQEQNPLLVDHKYGQRTTMYVDHQGGALQMNPSGRAFETGSYRDKGCPCLLATSPDKWHDNEEDWLEEHLQNDGIQFDTNGDIGFCCYCDAGRVGNVKDFRSIDDIKERILLFRKQFIEKYGEDNVIDGKMSDLCSKCKRFKITEKIYAPVIQMPEVKPELKPRRRAV